MAKYTCPDCGAEFQSAASNEEYYCEFCGGKLEGGME